MHKHVYNIKTLTLRRGLSSVAWKQTALQFLPCAHRAQIGCLYPSGLCPSRLNPRCTSRQKTTLGILTDEKGGPITRDDQTQSIPAASSTELALERPFQAEPEARYWRPVEFDGKYAVAKKRKRALVDRRPVEFDRKYAVAKKPKRVLVDWRPVHSPYHHAEINRVRNFRTTLTILSMARTQSDHAESMSFRKARGLSYIFTDRERTSVRRSEIERSSKLEHCLRTHTEYGFLAYIKGFVDHRPSRYHGLYDPQRERGWTINSTFEQRAIAVLSAFYDTDLRHVITIEAANIALKWFYKKQAWSYGNTLFQRLEYLFLPLPQSTCNIVLRAFASNKDDQRFRISLSKFYKHGFRPDAETWISFLMSQRSLREKRTVVRAMRFLGVLDESSVKRDVANQMCLYDYLSYKWDGKTIKDFLLAMRAQYGKSWLSPSSGNIIMAEVVRPSKETWLDAVFRSLNALHEMKNAGFVANDITSEILLKAGSATAQGDNIIQILETLRSQHGLVPDRRAHWQLFKYAWEGRKPHFLAVIWISACLQGFTTISMRRRITSCVDTDRQISQASSKGERFRSRVSLLLHQYNNHVPGMNPKNVPEDEISRNATSHVVQMPRVMSGEGVLRDHLDHYLSQAVLLDGEWTSRDASEDAHTFSQSPSRLRLHIVARGDTHI